LISWPHKSALRLKSLNIGISFNVIRKARNEKEEISRNEINLVDSTNKNVYAATTKGAIIEGIMT